jgi:radical SAM protein with 4Fe4S-binding SPASM domain
MKVVKVEKVLKNPQLMQIAFGIGDIDGNPDLYEMFAYARGNGVIPNVTINGWRMSDYHYNKLARLCGSIAVSHYDDKHCFNAIHELTSRGMTQVNIHKLLSKETFAECIQLLGKAKTDPRLKNLNAIVFLLLKPKGKRNKFTSIDNLEDYRLLAQTAIENEVQFGMDSCSAPLLLKATEGMDLFNIDSVEPCESTLFSLYINTDGDVFPCSFTEGQPGWIKGIPMESCEDFLKDVWFSDRLSAWREKLLGSSQESRCSGCVFQKSCRSCPEYNISICRGKHA